jgi:hypothetical protein
VDFGVDRALTKVALYFLDSEGGPAVEATGEEESGGFPLDQLKPPVPVLPPTGYELQIWDGSERRWASPPEQLKRPDTPEGRRANWITLPELTTSRIRVVLQHRAGATSGLTEVEAWGAAGLPLPRPVGRADNLAWNPGDQEYPKTRASFTFSSDSVGHAVDGRIGFTRYSSNRWTAYSSPHAEDWLEVDFGAPSPVGRAELFLFGDGRGVAAPLEYRIERWTRDGWAEVPLLVRDPSEPTAWALNTVTFEPVLTERVRVIFTHALPAVSGVTELRLWPR